MPVVVLLDEFLEWSSRNQAEATYEWYRQYLQSFADYIGKLRVRDLNPDLFTFVMN
jgi:hypothetical protein